MLAEEFKLIRQNLINPETQRSATQSELGNLLKSLTGKGSRDLVAKMESGLPIQKYIANHMITLKNSGWPVSKELAEHMIALKDFSLDTYREHEANELEEFRKEASTTLNSLLNHLEMTEEDIKNQQEHCDFDYLKELKSTAKEATVYLSKAINLIKDQQ